MKMRSSTKKKIKGLEDELAFCNYKLQGEKPLEHWSIRQKEITKQLKILKRNDNKNDT